MSVIASSLLAAILIAGIHPLIPILGFDAAGTALVVWTVRAYLIGLMGHSMGAATTAMTAMLYPDLVAAAILDPSLHGRHQFGGAVAVHAIDLRDGDHRAPHPEQLAGCDVLAGLRHDALVGGDDQHHQVDAGVEAELRQNGDPFRPCFPVQRRQLGRLVAGEARERRSDRTSGLLVLASVASSPQNPANAISRPDRRTDSPRPRHRARRGARPDAR